MKKRDFSTLRQEYAALAFNKNMAHADPIVQFSRWFEQAIETGHPDPSAMTLATVSPDGQPAARVVLLKDFDQEGFVFFTNYNSHKGMQLDHNPRAALVFLWLELYRQVRVEGTVQKVSPNESDEYYATRPRDSQLGAHASVQSKAIPDRQHLDDRYHEMDEKYRQTTPPRPLHWGGYRLAPRRIEFWQGRENRLNDRLLYEKVNDQWLISRLAP
ncbi:MAG: pyridoxamine 5'-phosphate oxidase [Bacteroidales bacterium]